MEEILKELKEELLNKKMSLLDLDNKVEEIVGTTESLYNFYLDDILEQKAVGYIYNLDKDFYDNDNNFIIEFKIIDKDYEEKLKNDEDYKFNIIVKITNIFIN